MGRNVREMIASLPRKRQASIRSQYRKMKRELEGLQELRLVAGKAQADVARALKIKQPSVSKIEKQADMYLSTLRTYVQAVGGELELVVHLPRRPALRLHRLGEVLPPSRMSTDRPTGKKRKTHRAGSRVTTA